MEAKLISGQTIQIDEEDVLLLQRYPWRAYKMAGKLRVVALVPREGREYREMLQLSRLICGAPARRPIWHKNGDTLDLRRVNLQVGGRDPGLSSANRTTAASR